MPTVRLLLLMMLLLMLVMVMMVMVMVMLIGGLVMKVVVTTMMSEVLVITCGSGTCTSKRIHRCSSSDGTRGIDTRSISSSLEILLWL